MVVEGVLYYNLAFRPLGGAVNTLSYFSFCFDNCKHIASQDSCFVHFKEILCLSKNELDFHMYLS